MDFYIYHTPRGNHPAPLCQGIESQAQVIFLIAGKLIKSGRKFILKLQEDWAYKEEYNEAGRRLESLVWDT